MSIDSSCNKLLSRGHILTLENISNATRQSEAHKRQIDTTLCGPYLRTSRFQDAFIFLKRLKSHLKYGTTWPSSFLAQRISLGLQQENAR